MKEINREEYVMTLTAPFYSIEEAAAVMGVSGRTIRRRIQTGEIKAGKVGSKYRIAKEELVRFFESSTQN